jgi:hypothetical protein
LENGHLEDQGKDKRMIIRWTAGKYFVRVEGGWNWLRFMTNSGIYYYYYYYYYYYFLLFSVHSAIFLSL